MLHTKPQGYWPFGSGEEDFVRVFIIYGRGGHFGHVTKTPILEEKIFENCGRRTDDGPWLYYKLTNEPKGSGELKIGTKGYPSGFIPISCKYLDLKCRHLHFISAFEIETSAFKYR